MMKSRFTVGDLERLIREWAPPAWADEWDNVGLLSGNPERPVGCVLAALEISSAVIEEARRLKAGAIITHHPLPLRPVRRIVAGDPTGKLLLGLIESRIAHIAAHTNLDRSPEGTNRILAERFGLKNLEFLETWPRKDLLKFSVFAPAGYEEKIIEAVGRAGAGVIGKYSRCTFRSPGVGSYVPMEGANPFAGAKGQLEQADELRFECLTSRAGLASLLAEVRSVHPYEEMAFDVFTLADAQPAQGLGYIGDLEKPATLKAFAQRIKRLMAPPSIQLVGDPGRLIHRVAVMTGSGKETARSLDPRRADVLVTGELDHHAACDALERGLAVLCLGHFESEVPIAARIAQWLRAQEPIKRFRVEVHEAQSEKSPFVSLSSI